MGRGPSSLRRVPWWALLLACVCACHTAEPPGETAVAAGLSVAQALGGSSTEGFLRASEVREFVFPRDHGPHPGYRTEWWYFTGNLQAANDRRFGFQLTLFRHELKPGQSERDSNWAADEIYMGHFALTDVGDDEFFAFERFSRAAMGLAGAQATPLEVWLEDWRVEQAGSFPEDAQLMPPLRLVAASGSVSIDLRLSATKPLVLQGDRGLSQKSADPGNASYYYSATRMQAEGELVVSGRQHAVRGTAWLDREWSTSALGTDQVGWDWFALQLENDTELMFYRLRRRDGSTDPFSAGTLVRPDGSARRLEVADVELDVTDRWESPRGGRYPAGWRMRVAAEQLELVVAPQLADQELDVTVRYWEGAVSVRGKLDGEPVRGVGYV
ncbi:MAG: carotenoid 1,2-hydratase, partial [Acidobacteriota bacterium]